MGIGRARSWGGRYRLGCSWSSGCPSAWDSEIQRLFRVPFAQSHVSRAIKFVDHWLQSIKAESPASRARRSRSVGPRRNEPGMPGTGQREACNEGDECSDWRCETSIIL